MSHRHIQKMVVLAASVFVVTVMLAAQSPDRFTLKSPNGIAFSELLGQHFHLSPPPGLGVPWHWSLHVWIWAHNPSGMFSEWNPSISCS
jgi:hypothetical protein